MVQRHVEDVEVAQLHVGGEARLAVEEDRHGLLRDPAVGAQRRIQPGKIVARGTGSQHHVAGRDHHDIAHAIGGQLEARAGFGIGQRERDAGGALQALDHELAIGFGEIDGRERSQRPVVHDVRIGDGQDHARVALA